MGAWIEIYEGTEIELEVNVAPLVGAWIEIFYERSLDNAYESLLSWERGLKLKSLSDFRGSKCVAPLVGAWIEIRFTTTTTRLIVWSLLSWERGLKYQSHLLRNESPLSLLSWERGLKYYTARTKSRQLSRSSRGSVD